ncbi:tape measure protein [Cohnella algarum]|uniref:tape measure protein n=1 Tax=Cohnella algarum TaxID=2044859 RepID=UPI001F07CF43|nr:tape measure protein [Cohnella algarum]
MPTISTTLRMMDSMSGTIDRINERMDRLIASAERVNRVMGGTGARGPSVPAAPVPDPSNQVIDIGATSSVDQVNPQNRVLTSWGDLARMIDLTTNRVDKFTSSIARLNQTMRNRTPSTTAHGATGTGGSSTALTVPANTVHNQQRMLQLNQQVVRVTQVINNNYVQINQTLNQTNHHLSQAANQQSRINQNVRSGRSALSGWVETLGSIYFAFELIGMAVRGFQAATQVSDDFINSLARIELINDGLQTTKELQQDIFEAADRARGSYSDMAGVIGRMGTLARDAFRSNEELVAFAELMQKSFRVSGASTMEQQAGMYQLSQAMAAGRLQGDEFRSIMENAPMLAQAIADFTGKSMGDLKEMSAEGTITADIIKGAMFSAADDINAKLETMPKTFGDVANEIGNSALQEFGPVIERINSMLNSPTGQQFVAGIKSAFGTAADAANWLLTAASNVYGFMSTNWPTIEPILWGITAAMLAWLIMTQRQAIMQGVLAVQSGITTAATFAQTAAVFGLRTAWLGLNAAQRANVMVFLITVIAGLIVWLIKLWQTNDQFAAGLMRVWNTILNFFDQVPIFFQIVGNGIINAFLWAKAESLQIMEDLVNGVIDGINWLIEKLNTIPGVELKAVESLGFAAKAAAEAEAIKQAGEEKVAEMRASAAQKAAERELKVQDMLDNRAAKRAREEAEKAAREAAEEDSKYDFDKFAKNVGSIDSVGKVGEVGKIKDTVDISSEDLKVMRDLAEMQAIQNFVTLTPTLEVTTGPITQDVDVDDMIAQLERRMSQEIESTARTVYGL